MRASSMKFFAPHEHRSHRSAQSFRKAEHHGVKSLGEFHDGLSRSRAGIENSRTIEVHGQPRGVRTINNVHRIRQRIDRAARQVGSVLQFDQPRAGTMVVPAANVRSNQVPGQDSIFGVNRARHDSGERRHHAHFKVVNMATVLANDLLSVVRQDLDGRLVPHGSGRNKQGRLTSKYLRRPIL